jgi:hypothetical protein
MKLSGMSKIVLISHVHGKEAILARVVAFETFTLFAHKVLGAKLVVVVFL